MTRLATAHAFMTREAVGNLGLPVEQIPGDSDVALVAFQDTATGEHRTLFGDGGWFRAWLACAAGWVEIVPVDLGPPYFPLEAPGWPSDWVMLAGPRTS